MKPGWRNLVVLLAALFMSATGATALENRFLLLVETTADSAKNMQATRDAVADLLVKGFNGIARPGDTIGVWLVGERLDTTFPMLVWQPAAARAYAVEADKFISKRAWTGRWNSTNALPALSAVAADSEALSVVLVTAPHSRLTGLPFSESVAEIQDRAAVDLERTRLPFVTFLTVRERKFTSAAVNSGLGPWTIPNPPLPQPVIVQAPAAKPGSGPPSKIEFKPSPATNLPAITPVVSVAAVKIQEPKTEPPAAVESKPVLATAPITESKIPTAPGLSNPAPVPAAAESKPDSVPLIPAKIEPAPPVPTRPSELPETSTLAEAKPKPEVPARSTVNPVAPAPAKPPSTAENAVLLPVPQSQKTTAAKTAATVSNPAMAASVNPPATGNGFLAAGIGALIGIGLLGWFLLRRQKAPQHSLITQSFKVK